MAASWTLVRSPKHAENILIQLRSPTAPSWPAVDCNVSVLRDVVLQGSAAGGGGAGAGGPGGAQGGGRGVGLRVGTQVCSHPS